MAQNPRTSETESAPTTGRNSGLTRRNYVRSLAAVATATTALGGAGAASAQDDYEVIEAEGQTITIGAGETWENKLIDMTTGQDIIVTAHSSDWTIRNVGFKGENTSGTGSATFGISDTAGGTCTVENVYLGDGSSTGNGNPNGHGQTAFWVAPDHPVTSTSKMSTSRTSRTTQSTPPHPATRAAVRSTSTAVSPRTAMSRTSDWPPRAAR